MSKFTNPLNNIKIASPCSADWNGMVGDERKRFCSDCKLNVYNLSGMSQREAENLLLNSENRVCVRFYRRADGTVLTKDCPVGWRAIKQKVSKTATAFASLVFAALSGIGLVNYFANSDEQFTTGQMSPQTERYGTGKVSIKEDSNVAVQGKPIATMGNVAYGNEATVGMLANASELKREFRQKRRH